jgi:hypothetical protein
MSMFAAPEKKATLRNARRHSLSAAARSGGVGCKGARAEITFPSGLAKNVQV